MNDDVLEHEDDPPLRRGAIAVCVHDGEVLVIQRSQLVEAPGAYCFPGGAIEPGESQEEALVRELREELGADVQPLRRLWISRTAWSVELHWWQAQVSNLDGLQPNAEEVADYLWLPPVAVRELSGLLSTNVAFLDALAAGEFAVEGL